MRSPMCKHWSTSHLLVVGPSCILLWWSQEAVVVFPCEGHRSTAPLFRWLLFVSTRGMSEAVYQPPFCTTVGGVGGHACPRS